MLKKCNIKENRAYLPFCVALKIARKIGENIFVKRTALISLHPDYEKGKNYSHCPDFLRIHFVCAEYFSKNESANECHVEH